MTATTGQALRNRRKAAGLSQKDLAQRADVSFSTVRYWEAADRLDLRGYAVKRMADALGWELPDKGHILRGRAYRVLSPFAAIDAWCERMAAQQRTRAAQSETERAAKRRVTCGAKTRKGTACRLKSEAGKTRCKFHGGKSTGPKTPEGKARIIEGQRRRWAIYHAAMLAAE